MKEIVGVLKVDIGDSKEKIQSLLEAVENLKKTLSDNVNVNLDLGNSLENIRKLENEISSLNADVEIEINDGDSEKKIQSLLAEIERLKTAIQSLDGKGVNNAVQIDANAEKSIKTLRDEIKQFKTAMETAEIGSEQFKTATEGLINAQNELKSALNLAKGQTEDVEGSYNALVKTMAELKKQWRATADGVERTEIGKQIDDINTQLKEMDASIGNYQRNVGNYAESFSQAMKAQQEATEVTRAKLESVQKVASGLASGYSALQGAMAMLGTENKNLEKTFVKLQAAIALAQGIGGLKDLVEGVGQAKVAFQGALMGVKSFIGSLNAMKTALIATGIGALVVAVGTLIAYWDELSAMFGDTERDIKRINDVVDDLKTKLSQFDEDNNFIVRLAEASGKAKDEILKLRQEQAKLAFEEAERAKQQAELNLEKAKKEDWHWNGKSEEVSEAERVYKETLEIEQARWKALVKANEDITVYNEEQKTKKREDEKKEADEKLKKSNETAEKELEATKKNEEEIKKKAEEIRKESLMSLMADKDKELAVLEDDYKKKKAILESANEDYQALTQSFNKAVDEVNEKYKELGGKELITSLNADIKASEQTADNKALDVENKYAIKQADTENPVDSIQLEIDKTLELQSIREQAFNEQLSQIQALLDSKQLSAEQEKELTEQYAELQMQRINETAKATTQIALLDRQLINEQKKQNKEYAKNLSQTFTSTLQGVSNILGALQEGIDTTNKEGFEKNKKIQTANATIGMLVGITNALAGMFTTKTGPWDLILAGIQAASIAASGAIQISNIQKQTFDGGSSAVATPNMSIAESMPVQYTKEILTDTETEKLNQPIKCYVLENDIREAHNKVDVAEGNATF